MFVFGSADLSTTFINENLFDEYRLAVVPVILGKRATFLGAMDFFFLKNHSRKWEKACATGAPEAQWNGHYSSMSGIR